MDLPGEAKGFQEVPGGAAGGDSGKDQPSDKSCKPEKGKGRGDRQKQDGFAGDGRKDDKRKKEKDRLIIEQQELLKKQLSEIGELLKKRKIKLILVFDLDGTLYIPPKSFQTSLQEKLKGKALHNLQQYWFNELSLFVQRFRAHVVLIYNTARSWIKLPSMYETGWINRDLSFMTDFEAVRQIHFKPFRKNGYSPSFGLVGLPEPDALIADNGKTIQLSEHLESQVDSGKLQSAREMLLSEYSSSYDEVSALHASDFTGMYTNLHLSDHSIGHMVSVLEGNVSPDVFEQHVYQRPRRTAICPRETTSADGGSVLAGRSEYYSSVVNKGSALCLLLELLQDMLESDGTARENIWEFVFGDACADLSMIRPDLEVRAFSKIPEAYLIQRNDIFRKLGFHWDYTMPPYWRQSIVVNKRGLINKHGSHVKESLEHPKVLQQPSPGLPGFMQPVLDALR